MGCSTCEGQPKNTSKDFTKAVIEINNPEQLVLLRKVVIPASLGDETEVPPATGKYHNVLLKYEANNHVYIYSSDGIPTLLESDVPQEVWDRMEELQQEIDDLRNSPDVVDIVATYAELQAYDTSDLGDKDVIRVLADETHDNESSYYRWSTSTNTWTFIGATGPYYTKSETDTLLDEKQDSLTAGDGITIENDTVTSKNATLARVLTTDDYNWPENNPDGVAIFRLPYGLYRTSTDGSVKYYTETTTSGTAYRAFLVMPNGMNPNAYVEILALGGMSGGSGNYHTLSLAEVAISDGVASGSIIDRQLVTSGNVVDSLTSSYSKQPLSANQGRILNEKIEAVKGLARELTTDDYNWPTSNPDGVALWAIPSGSYTHSSSVKVYLSTQQPVSSAYGYCIVNAPSAPSLSGTASILYWNNSAGLKHGQTVGGAQLLTNIIKASDVLDNLTSYSRWQPLSANQGRVLKGLIDAIVVPTQTSDLMNDGADGTSTYVEADELATVATTGSYSDLSGTPTIPTVNDATLTIQKNGTNVATFTANSSTNATANIEVPVITMTTTDPGEGSALAANNLLGVYGGDPVILDYSPTEINTGTTWIDSSTIYKKTINFGALPNNTFKSVAHSISNLSRVIKMEGYAYDSTELLSCSLPNNGISLHTDNTYVHIMTEDDLTSYTESYVTLYYTKSS